MDVHNQALNYKQSNKDLYSELVLNRKNFAKDILFYKGNFTNWQMKWSFFLVASSYFHFDRSNWLYSFTTR